MQLSGKKKSNERSEAITEFILAIFQANGSFLKWGDDLTAEFGLTSSRWQVMGALRKGPLTVADISRTMGLRRQSVQRTVDLLVVSGELVFAENPSHRRANLVDYSEEGKKKYQMLTKKYEKETLLIFEKAGLSVEDWERARHTIQILCEKL